MPFDLAVQTRIQGPYFSEMLKLEYIDHCRLDYFLYMHFSLFTYYKNIFITISILNNL